jgi:hypothetical protein
MKGFVFNLLQDVVARAHGALIEDARVIGRVVSSGAGVPVAACA